MAFDLGLSVICVRDASESAAFLALAARRELAWLERLEAAQAPKAEDDIQRALMAAQQALEAEDRQHGMNERWSKHPNSVALPCWKPLTGSVRSRRKPWPKPSIQSRPSPTPTSRTWLRKRASEQHEPPRFTVRCTGDQAPMTRARVRSCAYRSVSKPRAKAISSGRWTTGRAVSRPETFFALTWYTSRLK